MCGVPVRPSFKPTAGPTPGVRVVILDGDGSEVGQVNEEFEVTLDDVGGEFAGKVERAVDRAASATETVPWDGDVPDPDEGEYVSPPDDSELRPLEDRLRAAADNINEIDRELPVSEWPPYRAEVKSGGDGPGADSENAGEGA